jgi:hypothetical protein
MEMLEIILVVKTKWHLQQRTRIKTHMEEKIVQYYIQKHGGTPNVIPPISMDGIMAITTRLHLHKDLSGAPGQLIITP